MRSTILALVVSTLLVRGGVMLAMPDTLRDDLDRYRAVAENVLRHGTFGPDGTPTAYRPALYPLLLVPTVAMGDWSRGGIAALHLALGLGTVLLTWWLGRKAGLGGWALLAAALVACDPLLLRQSTLVMTETPAAFLAVLGLASLTWASQSPSAARAAAAGACLALAALCRPTFLPWLALSGLALAWLGSRPSRLPPAGEGLGGRAARTRRAAGLLLAFSLASAALLVPWAARNSIQFGRPIFSTTHGGYNLLLANNPYFYHYLRTAAWNTPWWSDELDRQWLAEMPRGTPADEVRADRLAYQKAWQNIRAEPEMFAWSCLVRVGRLFSPFPHQLSPDEGRAARTIRYAASAWYLVELPLALLGAVLLSWRTRPACDTMLERPADCASSESSDAPSHAGRVRYGEPHAGRVRYGGAVWLWAGLLVACFTATHALYWTDLRMRAPLVPVLALTAAAGAAWLSSRYGKGAGKRVGP